MIGRAPMCVGDSLAAYVRRVTARKIVPGGDCEKVSSNTHKSNSVRWRGNLKLNTASE